MNEGSKYEQFEDPWRALTVASLRTVEEDFERLGEARRKVLQEKGREWSKYSKRWGILRRLLKWIFSPEFERQLEIVGQDDEIGQLNLLKLLSPGDDAFRQCPKCGHYGLIATDFGYRKNNSGKVPQSWCKGCR